MITQLNTHVLGLTAAELTFVIMSDSPLKMQF